MIPRALLAASLTALLAGTYATLADDYTPPPTSNLHKMEFGTVPAAAESGDIRELERLLKVGHGTVEDVDGKGNTALIYAAMHGDVGMVKLLIDRGASIDYRDKLGDTAMHWAAQHGSAEVIRLLAAAKAAADLTNKQGITPLMMAAGNGHVAAVRLLLSLGADARRQDNRRRR
jgi:ankyrin repeat protein